MKFAQFAKQLDKIEAVAARLAKTELLADLFVNLAVNELPPACYLMQGRLVPQYKSLEFQLSEKMVMRALARVGAAERSEAASVNLFGEADASVGEKNVLQKYKQVGDLGLVAAELVEKIHQSATLELVDAFKKLVEIAQTAGEGSQEKKIQFLAQLYQQLDPLGAKYVTRVILGKMRLGFSTMTILDSLSWAVVGDKAESAILETAWQKRSDIGLLAQEYLALANATADERSRRLAETKLVLGIPMMPALCQRLNTSQEIIDKMGEVLVEPKYDGMRIQIHFDRVSKTALIFSRSLEDVSAMFPETKDFAAILNCRNCILDGEVIGIDPKSNRLLPFQETITRKRKHGVADQAKSVPVRFYIFDLLFLDDKSLIDLPLMERKQKLRQSFEPNQLLVQTPDMTTQDPIKLHQYHNQLLSEGLEGAVIKDPSSGYVSGRKGWRWVKIKEAEGQSGKLSDTLDVVLMGYFRGRGKRAQFGLGALLTGILDNDGKVVSIAKIGTGMSEAMLAQLKQLADTQAVPSRPAEYAQVDKTLIPDAWISPSIVLEIAADEITKSPTHAAKIALRFPRLIKIRTDKSWEQATTIEEISTI